MVWNSEEGATFQWMAIGEGMMDVKTYTETLRKNAPGVPLFVEAISNSARSIPYLKLEFWSGFPRLKASQITEFIALCRQVRPLKIEQAPMLTPMGKWLKEVTAQPGFRDAPYRVVFCHIPLRWKKERALAQANDESGSYES